MELKLRHAWGLLELAELRLRRSEAGDLELAVEALEQARTEFAAMGSDGYIERIDERLAELDG